MEFKPCYSNILQMVLDWSQVVVFQLERIDCIQSLTKCITVLTQIKLDFLESDDLFSRSFDPTATTFMGPIIYIQPEFFLIGPFFSPVG